MTAGIKINPFINCNARIFIAREIELPNKPSDVSRPNWGGCLSMIIPVRIKAIPAGIPINAMKTRILTPGRI